MTTRRLSFATLHVITNDTLEITIDDGVEVTAAMVDECNEAVDDIVGGYCKVLVNKINRYSYSFDGQLAVAHVFKSDVMAVVVRDRTAEVAANSLIAVPGNREKQIKTFYDRLSALEWLNQRDIGGDLISGADEQSNIDD